MNADSNTIHVLDHGFVRLIDHMGGDLSIVRAARVSHDADWRAGSDVGGDERLINYLMKNHHTTPFEAVVLTLEVQAPIFVFRQWHRHRTQGYNEVSARYTTLDMGFFTPAVESITTQSKTNKQGRTDEQHADAAPMRDIMQAQNESANRTYDHLLKMGCPRELARTVLPVANYSRMFATVNLHNLFHFLRLRNHSHAQREVQVYARAILDLIRPIAPVAVAAFEAQVAREAVDSLAREALASALEALVALVQNTPVITKCTNKEPEGGKLLPGSIIILPEGGAIEIKDSPDTTKLICDANAALALHKGHA